MKITSTDVWTVIVPSIPGRTASPCFERHDFSELPIHIIRIHTDEGVYGIGESGRGLSREAVEDFAASLEGLDPRKMILQELPATSSLDTAHEQEHFNRWWERSESGPRIPAYRTFEMAIFDLLGRYYDRPANWFLGGAVRDRVAADYWIGIQTPEDAAANTRLAVARGFKGMKLKCAYDECLIERCEAIWDVAGKDFALTIDSNQRFWRLTEALDVAKALAARGTVKVFEDPMPKWNLDWYRILRQHAVVPVGLHMHTAHDIVNAIKAEAVDYFNLDANMVQFVRDAAMAHAAGIPCWHGSGNDCGIAEHAMLQTTCVARNCVLGSDFVGSWTREDDLVVDGIQFEDGYALVPDKPGLGCELDMDAIENHRVA